MIADPQPYPAMKDSGVEWLGEVPEHWEVLPGRVCVYEKQEPNVGMVEDTVLSLSYGHIIVKPKEKLHGLVPESFETYQVIDPGDVICRPTDLQNDRTSLRFGIAEDRGIITSAYMCLGMLDRLEGRFGHLLFHAYDLKKIFYGFGSGLRQNLSWQDFKYLPCIIPPLSEQAAIVRYLDYVDRRVQRLVRAKQKLITLLAEQKQAIIHRAVTRGLDPDVPLRESGVEWLGKVPEHWEVRRVKTLFRLRIEKSGIGHEKELLSIFTHIGVRPRKDMEEKGNKASTTDDYWIVQKGDIICNKLLAWMGAIGVSHFEGVTSPAYDILMPVVELSPDYYHHLYRTKRCLQEFKQRSRGIMDMRLRLYFDQLGQVLVPFPRPEEQRAIVGYCDQATSDINAAINRAEREIELLNEYRTRLIADVITGKLDVREAAAALPDEESDDI